MNHIEWMRDLEERYKFSSRLSDRSQYKIFYSPIRPASFLVLGNNPGGKPEKHTPDGMWNFASGKIVKAAASAGYCENNEHDLLDCDWPENKIKKLLVPLLDGNEDAIRSQVVKTNIAFLRTPKAKDIGAAEKNEAAPFLKEIIAYVRPKLILLGGVKLDEFATRLSYQYAPISELERDPGVRQIVFWPAKITVDAEGSRKILAVQVAHASQFSWTYEKYDVASRIQKLLMDYSI